MIEHGAYRAVYKRRAYFQTWMKFHSIFAERTDYIAKSIPGGFVVYYD